MRADGVGEGRVPQRWVGQQVFVEVRLADGLRELTGELLDVGDTFAVLDVDGTTVAVPVSAVVTMRPATGLPPPRVW